MGRQKTVTKGNGNVTTNAFQADGALKSMREETSAGALVASHAYTYDANGNQLEDVASKRNADDASATLDSTTTYVYDPIDRLSKKTKTGHGASTETYVHDANANVIQQTVGGTSTSFNYDRNRLLSSTVDGQTASYRYDPFGRQTSVVGGGKTISRTTYDGFDHIKVAEQANDAGVLEATTYTYDPLDRTASKTTSGTDGERTDYTYLGLSQEVLGEEVAGELTKSYQYSPWGQRLSQVSYKVDTEAGVEAGETGYYGYNAHTDVESVTDDAGKTVATYGYTAYGENDEAEFTGIDKPDTVNPEQPGDESFNAYRFNGKRWDAGSGTYDMGFRDYNPGLNTFTTRDMYNGALADMGLGTDPFTSNRYAFAAGNPISGIEYDGHMLLDSPGGGSAAPAPTNSPGCGTWGLPACTADPEPKVNPAVEGMVSTGDGGDALGGAANSAIGISELTPFAGLVNALGLDDLARDTVNEELDVDTTTNAYAAGGITFDVATAFVGGGGGLAAKGTKTLASGASKAAKGVTRGGSGHGYAREVLPGGRPDGQTVFAGHGGYRYGAGDTLVPEGTTLHVYSEFGDTIPDSLGRAIEAGGDVIPVQTFGPGSTVPNYTLRAPNRLRIHVGSTTVEDSTNLSDLLQPNQGVCHWAACTEAW